MEAAALPCGTVLALAELIERYTPVRLEAHLADFPLLAAPVALIGDFPELGPAPAMEGVLLPISVCGEVDTLEVRREGGGGPALGRVRLASTGRHVYFGFVNSDLPARLVEGLAASFAGALDEGRRLRAVVGYLERPEAPAVDATAAPVDFQRAVLLHVLHLYQPYPRRFRVGAVQFTVRGGFASSVRVPLTATAVGFLGRGGGFLEAPPSAGLPLAVLLACSELLRREPDLPVFVVTPPTLVEQWQHLARSRTPLLEGRCPTVLPAHRKSISCIPENAVVFVDQPITCRFKRGAIKFLLDYERRPRALFFVGSAPLGQLPRHIRSAFVPPTDRDDPLNGPVDDEVTAVLAERGQLLRATAAARQYPLDARVVQVGCTPAQDLFYEQVDRLLADAFADSVTGPSNDVEHVGLVVRLLDVVSRGCFRADLDLLLVRFRAALGDPVQRSLSARNRERDRRLMRALWESLPAVDELVARLPAGADGLPVPVAINYGADDECPICRSVRDPAGDDGEPLPNMALHVVLSCRHWFHWPCFRDYEASPAASKKCPTCRGSSHVRYRLGGPPGNECALGDAARAAVRVARVARPELVEGAGTEDHDAPCDPRLEALRRECEAAVGAVAVVVNDLQTLVYVRGFLGPEGVFLVGQDGAVAAQGARQAALRGQRAVLLLVPSRCAGLELGFVRDVVFLGAVRSVRELEQVRDCFRCGPAGTVRETTLSAGPYNDFQRIWSRERDLGDSRDTLIAYAYHRLCDEPGSWASRLKHRLTQSAFTHHVRDVRLAGWARDAVGRGPWEAHLLTREQLSYVRPYLFPVVVHRHDRRYVQLPGRASFFF